MRLLTCLVLIMATARCGDFPVAGEPSAGRTSYPELIPLAGVVSLETTDDPEIDADELLQSRADALQARAEAIRNEPL